ncbi:MAG TPA: toll/interleukin-1 receptor domain-containing protein [Pirellulales bacterium]|nr:toll/interleukin-1 receptor domain-containing protein [Pirellulales bacterium]
MHWTDDISLLFEPLRELCLATDDGATRSVMADGAPELSVREYDNWNGGTTYYALAIHIPVHLYAKLEDAIENIERKILAKVEKLQRRETHDFIREVLIQPMSARGPRIVPSSESSFWLAAHFRLFVSHLSENKLAAANLKSALAPYGISAFVAHEDIKPTQEWQDEIEKAPFSMDGLAAILAPRFGESLWTDHEVGLALGRGVIVLPIRYGLDPYGLPGKYQGLQGKGRTLREVAEAVFRAFLDNSRTSGRFVSCLVEQYLLAAPGASLLTKLKLLDRAEVISTEQLSKIREKAANIPELRADSEFLAHVNRLLNKHGAESVHPEAPRADFPDDDIPF